MAQPSDPNNPLRGWRHLIAKSLSIGLGNAEAEERFAVHAWPVPVLPGVPCAVIEPGGGGSYVSEGDFEDPTSFCEHSVAAWRVWLFAGIPGDEAAWDELDRLIALTPGAVNAIPAHPSFAGAPPTRGDVTPPTQIEYGGTVYLGAIFDLSMTVSSV